MSRKGFTLVEIMVVVVLAGLMSLIGFPKIRSSLLRAEVRGAVTRITAVYASARSNAIQTNRFTTLNTAGNRIWVTVDMGGTIDTLGTVEHLDAGYGVSLNTDNSAIRLDPRGISNGSAKFLVTRADFRDSVMIGTYGSVLP